MHPNLPSGVHAKTLEVFVIVFENLGSQQLADDLPLWMCGIFPFLANASMSVKPALLSIYETYILPLGPKLQPATKAFILALLPGIEEENNEFFEPVVKLLDKLNESMATSHFFECIWLAIISSPGLRRAAFNYLLKRVPKTNSADTIKSRMGDPCWFVRAITVSLEDKEVLVQRGALELLLNSFPLACLEFADDGNVTLLLEAVLAVLLKKDMSLNRRVYSWLLGPEGAVGPSRPQTLDSTQTKLVNTLQQIFDRQSTSEVTELAKPYKIMVSLLDRNEIGAPVAQAMITSIIHSLRANVLRISDPANDLLGTANMFFDMIDPFVFWQNLVLAVANHGESVQSGNAFELASFVLTKVRLTDEDVARIHLPQFFTLLNLHLVSFMTSPLAMEAGDSPTVQYLSMIDDALAMSGASWRNLLQIQQQLKVGTVDDLGCSSLALHDRLLDFYALPTSARRHSVAEKSPVSGLSSPQLTTALSTGNALMAPTSVNLVAPFPELLRVSLTSFLSFFRCYLKETLVDSLSLPLLEKLVGITTRVWETCGFYFVDLLKESPNCDFSVVVKDWCTTMLECVSAANDFDCLDLLLTCVLEVFPLLPTFLRKLAQPQLVETVVKRIWTYLTPDYTLFHLRATELIWNYCELAGFVYVEKVIAQYLTESTRSAVECVLGSSEFDSRALGPFDRFGVFYRLSDEQHLDTALKFSRPMMLVCDLLHSSHPVQRRIGETWLRNHVQNFMRLIEPLIHILTHPSISFEPAEFKLQSGETVELFYYSPRPIFNQNQVEYAFTTLRALCEFAPRDFARGCSGAVKSRQMLDKFCCANAILEEKVSTGKLKYSEFFVLLCKRYLQTEYAPSAPVDGSVRATNTRIQMQCAAFLASVLKQLDKPSVCTAAAAALQETVVVQLLYCIETRQLDKQVEYLRVLGAYELVLEREIDSSLELKLQRIIHTLQTATQESILARSNRRILNHWIDFMLERLVYTSNAYRRLLQPVIACLCSEMVAFMKNFKRYQQLVASAADTPLKKRSSALTGRVGEIWAEELYPEQDVIVLMNALEKLLMVSLSDPRAANNLTAIEDGVESLAVGNANSAKSSALFGERKKQANGNVNPKGYVRTREAILNILPSVLMTYHDFWCWFDRSFEAGNNSGNDGLGMSAGKTSGQFERDRQSSNARIGQRLQRKIKDFMDALFDIYPNDLIESLVEIWYSQVGRSSAKADAAIGMLHSIQTCTPKHIIMAVFDIVKYRTLQPPQSANVALQRFLVRKPELSDYAFLQFLEEYCSLWMDLDSLGELLPYILLYCREVFGIPSRFKQLLGCLLRLVTVCFDRAAQNMFYDDKKLKKDVEDVYPRLCEFCIHIAGRTFDQKVPAVKDQENAMTTFSATSKEGVAMGDASAKVLGSALRPSSESRIELRRIADVLQDFKEKSDDVLSDDMIRDLAQSVFPSLRKILQDSEKVASLLTSVTAVIVEPVLRGKNRPSTSDRYMCTLDLLCAMTKIPNSYRSYRKEVVDSLLDPRFFEVNLTSVGAVERWFVILSSCTAQEREIFSEVLGRTSPSTSLFSSNTPERAAMLRRIALLILSAQSEHIVPLLPELQEKLVELLKSGDVPLLQVHVYLILQMLLYKLSWKAVASLWPTLISELVKLFADTMRRMRQSRPGTASESLEANPVIVAACQFLDLMLCMQPEGFQPYQWIFVTDVFPNQQSHYDGVPGLVDQLWQRLVDRGTVSVGTGAVHPTQLSPAPNDDMLSKTPLAQTVTSGLGKLASSITSLAISSSSMIRSGSTTSGNPQQLPHNLYSVPLAARSGRPSFSGGQASSTSSLASMGTLSGQSLPNADASEDSSGSGECGYVPPTIIPYKCAKKVPLSFQRVGNSQLDEYYSIRLHKFLSTASGQMVTSMKGLAKADFIVIERMLACEFVLPPAGNHFRPPLLKGAKKVKSNSKQGGSKTKGVSISVSDGTFPNSSAPPSKASSKSQLSSSNSSSNDVSTVKSSASLSASKVAKSSSSSFQIFN